VLQLVYVKVLSGKVHFEQRSSFKTWLFGIIRVTALEQRRLRWFRHRHAPSDTIDVAVPVSEPRVDRETAEALSRGMQALSSRQREALHLTFYEGLSISEAAGVMNVSLGTARLHYERGKAALLAHLAREGVNFP
jgi:RNA polymerase sigma-70 factor (ECF subfamily)